MATFEPGDTKAWRVELVGAGELWVTESEAVVLECTDDDEAPLLTQERVEALQPGDSIESACESHAWTVTCHMVDKAWLDNLPEHDGW